jgi:rfaE bifunctional protein kinase chain/domain
MPGKIEMKSYASLKEVFSSFENLKVLIIGDVMLDSYLWGKVERISPEAPVPILHVQKRDKRLGGAANVALNVQSLGAIPVLCSVIGEDAEGSNFLSLLEKSDLSQEGIVKSNSRITTIKHRVMSGAHHMLRVDEEMDHEISKEDFTALLGKIKHLMPTCDVVIFEDYDKGVINQRLIEEVIAFAKSRNVPTIVDPKKRNFLHYKGASLFKPNKKELKEGLKVDSDLSNIDDLENAIALLQSKINAGSILITLSEKGVYISQEGQKVHIPAHLREISDVSGAGDTVISIAALCYALHLSPRFIAELSNLGGGLVCEHVGVVPINKEDLLKEAVKLNMHASLQSNIYS